MGVSNNIIIPHIKLHYEYIKVGLSTAMEYRKNFFLQVFSMMINDLVWIIFWLIFFAKFESLNGWGINEMLMLYAIATVSFGLGNFLFGNMLDISYLVSQGRLDFYLTLPKNRLYHVLMSRSSFYALGDLLFGLILTVFFVPISSLPLFSVLIISSMMIFVGFAVIVNSLAFYIGNAVETSKSMFMILLSLAMYPITMYKGLAKIILLTIIPAGFITGIPIELLKSFNWYWLLATLGFAFATVGLGIFLFYRGIRRYESGNLLYCRI